MATMKVEIRGVIVPNDEKWIYEWLGFEATSPADVQRAIEAASGAGESDKPPEDLEVVINSYGGEVYSGSEIYTALKGYPGKVVVKIVGLAASAASLIAMAGDPVMISPTAQIMIHNVQSIATGDHRTHEHEAGVLRSHDAGIANAYRLKSGMGEAELLELMGKETWLNAQQALEHKLVDEIMFDDQAQLAASASPGGAPGLLPREVINKMRNVLVQERIEGGRGKVSEEDEMGRGQLAQAAKADGEQPGGTTASGDSEHSMTVRVWVSAKEIDGASGDSGQSGLSKHLKHADKLASARLSLLKKRGEHVE